MKNNDSVFFFTDKNIPGYIRIIIPMTCLFAILAGYALYSLLPEIRILTLPYKPPPGVYFYRFPSGPDTVITLKHLSIPIVCFIVGICTGIVSFLTPLRKNIDDLWWGILSSYLIFAFSLSMIFTIQIIWTELTQIGILSLFSNIIGIAACILAIWFLSLVGVLCLLIIPQIGGFMIVAKPKM